MKVSDSPGKFPHHDRTFRCDPKTDPTHKNSTQICTKMSVGSTPAWDGESHAGEELERFLADRDLRIPLIPDSRSQRPNS